jgi:hypothetical protein
MQQRRVNLHQLGTGIHTRLQMARRLDATHRDQCHARAAEAPQALDLFTS